jgi:thymidylate synthase (FAD)
MARLAKLLNIELSPEIKKCYIAYRRCYSNKTLQNIIDEFESKTPKQIMQFIFERKLHESALEHINFCFSIEDFSRISSQQETRHRIQSISQQSQRYCLEKDEIKIIIPPSIQKHADLTDWMNRINEEVFRFYNACIQRKIPKEDARYILLNATETKLIVSFNLRSLMNFMNERLCNHAQWEIRNLAKDMKSEVTDAFKFLSPFLVPKCRKFRYCPENKCCGYYKETMAVKDLFSMDRYVRFIQDIESVSTSHYNDAFGGAYCGCLELHDGKDRLHYFSQYGSFKVETIMLMYAKISGLMPYRDEDTITSIYDMSRIIEHAGVKFMPIEYLYEPNYIQLQEALKRLND